MNSTNHEHDDSDPIAKASKRPSPYNNNDDLNNKKRRFGTGNDIKIIQESNEMEFEMTSPESSEILMSQENSEVYKEHNFNLRSGIQRGESHRNISEGRKKKEVEVTFETGAFWEAGYDADDEEESEI